MSSRNPEMLQSRGGSARRPSLCPPDRKEQGVYCMIARSAVLLVSLSMATSASAQSSGAHLPLADAISAPRGAADLCSHYAWACQSARSGNLDPAGALRAAREVNRRVNQRVRPVEDMAQYRAEDHWALPTRRGGDCEDFALLKKFELMQRGVPADRLLIATVFSRTVGPHAVLVLRLGDGDHVLDNVTDEIKPWDRTGYTFLAVQNPRAPETWLRVSTKG
jgi:predicted transglutaminase-like cysteine proteinase